jgi:transposase
MKKLKKIKIPMEVLFDRVHGCKDEYKRPKHRPLGYILVKCPDHPFAKWSGHVLEHRLFLEKKIGRFLTPVEVGHHLDHDRENNDLNNLVLCKSNLEHMRKYHSKQFDSVLINQIRKLSGDVSLSRLNIAERLGTTVSCVDRVVLNKLNEIEWTARDEHVISESLVEDLLKTNNNKEVAQILGIHVGTLQRKFPKFFYNTKSHGFLEVHKAEILALKNAGLSNAKIAKQFDTNKNTIWAYLQRWEKNYPRKSNLRPQGFLDEFHEEIEKLLLKGVPQLQIAQAFETSGTTLYEAIRRWSRQGVLSPDVVYLLNLNPHLKQKLL